MSNAPVQNEQRASRATPKQKRIIALIIVLQIVISIPLYFILNRREPIPPPEPINLATTPVKVERVRAEVKEKSVDRGYIVYAPDWVVVTTLASLVKPDEHNGSFEPELLVPAQIFGAISEIAMERDQVLTYIARKTNVLHDGKPVIIVTTILYAGKELPLRIKPQP